MKRSVNPEYRGNMARTAAALAALAGLAFIAGPVSASQEHWIALAFVNPHAPAVHADDARVLFDDVNRTRLQHGLQPLADDPQLDRIARDVAEQMVRRQYFGHTDPSGVTFEQRLSASGYRFRFAAENMAFDADVAHANAALLQSPGHFANIVDRTPRKLGTAVVAAGEGQIFFVEEFAG